MFGILISELVVIGVNLYVKFRRTAHFRAGKSALWSGLELLRTDGVLRLMTVYRVQSTWGSENETQAWNSEQSLWRKTANLRFGVCKEHTIRVEL